MYNYTLRQASDILGVRVRTLRWWISENKIKADKIDRQWRVSDAEIERIMNLRSGTVYDNED